MATATRVPLKLGPARLRPDEGEERSSPTVSRLRWRLPLVLALVGLLMLPFDIAISRWCLAGQCPGFLEELFTLAEVFGHGIGVGCLLLTALVLDPPVRRWIVQACLAAFGSGLTANGLKLLVSRIRPRDLPLGENGWSSFEELFPLLSAGSTGQGFPSAHTATAVGLAVALARLYPRGRWLFAAFAVLAALQRIEVGAHFPSDALWGAAVGLVIGQVALRGVPARTVDERPAREHESQGLRPAGIQL